ALATQGEELAKQRTALATQRDEAAARERAVKERETAVDKQGRAAQAERTRLEELRAPLEAQHAAQQRALADAKKEMPQPDEREKALAQKLSRLEALEAELATARQAAHMPASEPVP